MTLPSLQLGFLLGLLLPFFRFLRVLLHVPAYRLVKFFSVEVGLDLLHLIHERLNYQLRIAPSGFFRHDPPLASSPRGAIVLPSVGRPRSPRLASRTLPGSSSAP